MNHGVMIHDLKENIAAAIWEGKAIMGTDGLVKQSTATFPEQTSPPMSKVVDPMGSTPSCLAPQPH
jgi:hypothetical protein